MKNAPAKSASWASALAAACQTPSPCASPDIISAAVPFYGRQPAAEDVPKIKGALLIHYAELDRRINRGWPDYEAALKEAGVNYTAHIYENVNHGFHNDTTPRYDEAAAKLAWQRTIDFFNETLKE